MDNNRVDSFAFLEFESDRTTLTLENTETSVCHCCEKVLPGETARKIFSVLGKMATLSRLMAILINCGCDTEAAGVLVAAEGDSVSWAGDNEDRVRAFRPMGETDDELLVSSPQTV